MPSIDGGSSTGIDYAPHMYVLREGGNYLDESDYIFVANATTFYDDLDRSQYGDTHEEQKVELAKSTGGVTYQRYHIGISPIEGLVGDVQAKKIEAIRQYGKTYMHDTSVKGSHRGIPAEDIPGAAKSKLIKFGLTQLSMMAGHTILGGFGIELPADLEPLDLNMVFNGTPEEQAAEYAKQEQWQNFADELRHTLGIE